METINWQERAEKAEAELAKLLGQKPIKYLYRVTDCFGNDVLRDDPKGATIIETIPLYAAPPPPQQSQWQPIETAQNDKPYIVGWIDDDGADRHDFDIMDDGVWRIHDDICEMAEACAPAGGIMPNRTAPYTHYIELMPLPEPAP